MNKTAICLGSIILSVAAASATAKIDTFAFSPAELSTLAGIEATHERIESKAQQFCRQVLRGTRGLSAMTRCVQAVTGEIVDRINDGRLTAYARTGRVDEALLAKR